MTKPDPQAVPRETIAQDQFLTVLSRDEALRRFEAALRPAPLGVETLPIAQALGRVLAETVRAPIDVPPFDRSGRRWFRGSGRGYRDSGRGGAGDAAPQPRDRGVRRRPEASGHPRNRDPRSPPAVRSRAAPMRW
jgi:putative molybdopterin biosynthesis protein